ncbi:aspartyl protease family protein [Paraglaciecola hydrolytica]|nr:aspartyl protease family protein [Paraglaciecola hydrolytica]
MKYLCTFLLFLFCNSGHASVSTWVDVTIDNGHIKFPVVVQGYAGMAILDSGAFTNGLNENFKLKHNINVVEGKKIDIRGAYGHDKRATYVDFSVEMFGANLSFENLLSVSLGHSDNAILLGAGFMKQFVFQIDYVNKRMRILGRDSIDLKKVQNLDMKSQRSSGVPIVKVGLNNEENVWLLLDTGNNGSVMLERSIAIAHHWLDKYPTKSSIIHGAIRAGYNDTFNLPELKIGPYTLENVFVSVPAKGQQSNLTKQYQEPLSRIKSKKVEGILGYDVLKHFVLTIDYAEGLGHLGIPEKE